MANRERELFSDMPRTKKIERIEMAEWVSMDEASTDPYGSCRMVCPVMRYSKESLKRGGRHRKALIKPEGPPGLSTAFDICHVLAPVPRRCSDSSPLGGRLPEAY